MLKLFIISLLLLLSIADAFQLYKTKTLDIISTRNSYCRLYSQNNNIPPEIARKLIEYLELRRVKEQNNVKTDEVEVTIVSKEVLQARQKAQRAKEENIIISTFKPSGWFKDKVAIDLAKRADKSVPKTNHPLSFVELKKFGFEYLTESVMQLGGPFIVGEAMGIEWTQPDDKEVCFKYR